MEQQWSSLKRILAGAAGALTVAVLVSCEATPSIGPIVEDGMLQPVPEFADTTQWIRTRLWVETGFDTDGDGIPDRIHVDITRPAAAEQGRLRVPVIMEASPYAAGTSGPRANLWDVRQELDEESPPRVSQTHRPFNPNPPHLGSRLASRYVPLGFAVASVELLGTGLSTGCPTIGDIYETNAPKYVIDWLNGRAKGYTTVDGFEEVRARSWTNGKVGMIGTSYLGTTPLSAAITGVKGLEAIVPIAPNTSYYHYYRSNGLVRSPGGWLGEDIDFLYDFVRSGRTRERCDSIWRDGLFAEHRDRRTGDFNDFWEARDQLPHIGNVRAAVFFAHGFNDWNVMPEHTIRMWEALKHIDPQAKIYLHQGGHGGGPPADLVNMWWARYLYGVKNGIDTIPRALIVPWQGPVPQGERPPAPIAYADYPVPGSAPVTLFPGRGGNGVGTLHFTAPGDQGAERFTDDATVSPSVMARSPDQPNRLIYALPAFQDTVHMSGTTTVTIRLAASKPAANLSVYLVTLPFDGASVGTAGRVGVVTRGWADPRNHRSLSQSEPLEPGRFYELSFDLQPTDQIIPQGSRIGLMVFSSDREFTLWPAPGTMLTVDLDGTMLRLPVVGGETGMSRALAPRNR